MINDYFQSTNSIYHTTGTLFFVPSLILNNVVPGPYLDWLLLANIRSHKFGCASGIKCLRPYHVEKPVIVKLPKLDKVEHDYNLVC